MVDFMIIEMGGDDGGLHIISRMLYRCKCIDLLTVRKYYDSSGVLTGGTAHSHAPLNQTVYFCGSFFNSLFFIVFFDHSVGCFICKGTYGSCLKGVALSENDSGVGMSLCLVFSRKVKVDIRLLVTFESKESLEWYIIAPAI